MNQRSAYLPQNDWSGKLFGVYLGLLIMLFFLWFKPSDLLSIESVVSVIGAYIAGKEVWSDIEKWLIRLTKNSRLRFIDAYYSYRLDTNTTLTNYGIFAKRQRYRKAPLLPVQMDFLKHSNSQTVRMLFDQKDLMGVTEPLAHMVSLSVQPHLLPAFVGEGYLLGVKLSLNKRLRGWRTKHIELFQSLHHTEKGCLDEQQQWTPHAVFYRRTYSCGRWKFFAASGTWVGYSLVDMA